MANSITSCMLAKVKQGLIDNDKAQDVIGQLEKLSPREAAGKARVLLSQYQDALDQTVRQNLNHLDNLARFDDQIAAGKGKWSLTKDNLRYQFSDRIGDAQSAIMASFMKIFPETLEKIRPGWWETKGMRASTSTDILNAFYGLGGKTPEAQIWANELHELYPFVNNRLIDAGVIKDVPTKSYIPINFNGTNISRVDFGEFMNDILGHVDRDHFDQVIGSHLNEYKGDLGKYFEDVHKSYTVGNIDREAPIPSYKLEETFKDAIRAQSPDSWMYLSQKYGDGNVFETLMNDLESKSKRIARDTNLVSMDHANAAINYIKDKLSQNDSFKASNIKNLGITLERDAKAALGRYDRFAFERNGANTFATNLPVNVKQALQGAVGFGIAPTAIAREVVLGSFARALRGMDVIPSILEYAKNIFNYKNSVQKAVKLGVFSDYYTDALKRDAAFNNSSWGLNFTKGMGVVGRSLGFTSRVTNAGRMESLTTSLAHITEWALEKNWQDLDARSKIFIRRSGINENDWQLLRDQKDKLMQSVGTGGAKYLDLNRLLTDDNPNIRKLGQNIAILGQDLKTAATPIGNYKLNTFKQVMSSQYKYSSPFVQSLSTFMAHSISLFEDHILLPMRIDPLYGAKYISTLVPAYTLIHYLGKSAIDYSSGKEAENPQDWHTWLKSATGMLGPFQSYMMNGLLEQKGNQASSGMGIPIEMLTRLSKAVFNDSVKMFDDDPKNQGKLGKDLLNQLWTFAPKPWYLRAVMERMIKDNILRMVDPNAENYFNQQIERQEQNGSGFWWNPGASTPKSLSLTK